ncbi:hypothetical protein V757_08180 [Pelistega indica]|uniref:Uncharacterized protein n=1 Tax=Pelistega indica TaxID=1414851 RepID=V8G305_9BURK|nr:hypothetical protein V757_08180 [Pelistega indica]
MDTFFLIIGCGMLVLIGLLFLFFLLPPLLYLLIIMALLGLPLYLGIIFTWWYLLLYIPVFLLFMIF